MKLRNKILLILFGVAASLIIGLYLAFFRFGVLEYLVNKKIRDTIKENLPLQIQIGKIGGDYRSFLVISNLTVIYDDGTINYKMASVPRITARYSLSDLYNGKYSFQNILVDSAQINIQKSPAGKWLIPKAPPGSAAKTGSIAFDIGKLTLNNIDLSLTGTNDTLSFRGIFIRTGLENREGTLSADIDTLSYQASEDKYKLRAAKGKVALTGENLMCQDFAILTDSSDLKISGQMILNDERPWKVNIEAAKLNLTEASEHLGAILRGDISTFGSVEYSGKKFKGKLRISGMFEDRYLDSLEATFQYSDRKLRLETLEGVILHGCRIAGKGEVNFSQSPPEYHLIGNIEHLNLENVISHGHSSDLNGKIDFTGRGFSGKGLAIDLFADLGESSFDNYHVSDAIGNMTVTTDSLTLQDEFLVRYKDNLFTLAGKIEYSGGIQVEGSTMFDDLSAFNGKTFIKRMGGRADLDFQITGDISNPDISGQLTSDSLWLYDIHSSQAGINFHMAHFLHGRQGDVDLFLNSGEAYNRPYDTIRIKMQVDSERIYIDDSFIYSKYFQAGGTGTLDYASYPQKLSLDSLTLDIMGLSFKNDSLIEIGIDSTGYDLLQCHLLRPIGHLTGSGRINYNESMELDISMDKLDILPIVRLITGDYGLTGLMSGEMRLKGTFASPAIDFRGNIGSLTYNEFVLGDLHANLEYSENVVSIDSITIDSKTGYYTANGTFPINLSFTQTENRLLDNEQNINITAADVRHDAIRLFLKEVENLKGDLKAAFKLTGTPRQPKIDGEISLRRGTLKLYDLTYPLDSLNINMKMANRTIYIESASAVCWGGKKLIGTVTGQGEIIIKSIDTLQYSVKIKLNSFPVLYELGDISALVDAALKVYGETPPTVYGDVTIKSALYRENFSKESDGWIALTSLQGDKTWDLNLNVEAPSNLWVKNEDIDAEFSGLLNFIREKGKYRYIGSLEILRGKGFLADRSFRLESGGSINYEDIEYPNPRLDIYASTKIRGAASERTAETNSSNYDLRVHISGTLDEPIIGAAEGGQGSPQFSTEEIIPLIFTDYYGKKEGSNGLSTTGRVSDRLTSGISGFLSSQVGQIGSRTLGVETFEIDPVYGDKFDPLGTRLTLGFYTHLNLYVYGSSSISGVAGQEVGFEYRLKRFLLMEGRRDEENLYHLLLNFYWDF